MFLGDYRPYFNPLMTIGATEATAVYKMAGEYPNLNSANLLQHRFQRETIDIFFILLYATGSTSRHRCSS
jgi:hypothetical protein